MSRSDYSDDLGDEWSMIRYRGAVNSAIKGKRGQAFLREMLAALDALPTKELIRDELQRDGQVCAIGSVGAARGVDLSKFEVEDNDYLNDELANEFGIARALVAEIEFMNDDDFANFRGDDKTKRFERVRAWILKNLASSGSTETK